MSNKKIYESIGSSTGDDWMERERRYEARQSPWDLDDNAAYLDEEHRKHCEAREARKAHERECEVPRPAEVPNRPRVRAPAFQTNVKPSPTLNKINEKAIAGLFGFFFILVMFFILSMILQILLRF